MMDGRSQRLSLFGWGGWPNGTCPLFGACILLLSELTADGQRVVTQPR